MPMNQVALTVIIIAVPLITASAAITGTIVGALLVGIFAYLMQKRALDFGFGLKSTHSANEAEGKRE